MKIAVIGPGDVGATLGRRFVEAGRDVVFGTPRPEQEKYDVLRDLGCAVLPPQEAADPAEGAEAILLAVPWAVVADVIRNLGDLKDRLVIDATNPIREDFLDVDHETQHSGAERIAELAPRARVVKAFNTVSVDVMADPVFGDRRAALAVAGGDRDTRETVMQLARDIGFDPYDSGPLAAARSTERFAWHWIEISMIYGDKRNFAFALLER